VSVLLRGRFPGFLIFLTIQVWIGLAVCSAADDAALRARLAQAEQEVATLKEQIAANKAEAKAAKAKASAPKPAETVATTAPNKGPLVANPAPKDLPSTNLNLPPDVAAFWQNHFILRQSVFDEQGNFNDATGTQPASFSYTHARNGVDSWATDLGVGYLLTPRYEPDVLVFEGGLGIDYHRNTLTTAKKDIFQVGGVGNLALGNGATKQFAALITGSASYKDDDVKDVQTVQAALTFVPVKLETCPHGCGWKIRNESERLCGDGHLSPA
jgi:hypothetical protein